MSKQIVAGKISKCCGVAVYLEGRYGGTHEFEYCTKCRKRQDLQDASRETTTDGKVITKTEHPDGRKDVTIGINMLDVKATDEETAQAKKVIEEDILPNMQASMVMVVVIHKPSNQSTSNKVSLPRVREFAEAAVRQFRSMVTDAPDSDFIVVEVHEGSMLTRVSTLQNL